jgi:hypothetical protein
MAVAATAETTRQRNEMQSGQPMFSLVNGTELATTQELQPKKIDTSELYGASLVTIRAIGEVAVGVEIESSKEYELGKDDFVTSLAEMLKTDKEFQAMLDVDTVKHFDTVDGKTVTAKGEPIVEIVERGYNASKDSNDHRISTTQALRDRGDVLVATEVESLAPGESLLAVSMQPAHELAGPDRKFWEDMGYREGIAYIQWYTREPDGVFGGALSVDASKLEAWVGQLEKLGVKTDTAVTPNTLIQHTYRFAGDAQYAHSVARDLRKNYYQTQKASRSRRCISEFLHENEALIDAMYKKYYPAIGRSLVTGKNDEVLQSFSHDILQHPIATKLESQLRSELIKVANSKQFDADMGRAMDKTIRFGVAELLRDKLEEPVREMRQLPLAQPNNVRVMAIVSYEQQVQMQQQIVASLSIGVAQNRSYGGCSNTSMNRSENPLDALKIDLKPQGVFGGKVEDDDLGEEEGPDGLGPLTFKCTEGHYNTRKQGKLLTVCQTKPCKEGSVGCK